MLNRKSPAPFASPVLPPSLAGRSVAFMSGSALPVSERAMTTARVRPPRDPEAPLALTDPALAVVTDFTWQRPATVREDCTIDDGLREMMLAGVRALLVVRDDVVTGLITSYDIQGERTLQFLYLSGFAGRDEIEVRHIMTPWERVATLDWQTVRAARVHTVVEFLQATSATHVVIVEHAERDGVFVRGLISRARLERQLGCPID
jgi:CBS domain-containing protein